MALLIFIAILVALIWVHELGHFSVAKLFGIRVDEFAIGFPPRALSVKHGETEYSFNLLLIGGYVRIYGENVGEEDDPRSLARKNRGIQALVMVAGVAFNVLFALLLLSLGYMAGLPAAYDPAKESYFTDAAVTVVQVLPGSPAEAGGLVPGDKIKNITTATDFIEPTIGDNGQAVQAYIAEHQDLSLIFFIDRNGEASQVLLKAAEGIVPGKKVVGIQMGDTGTLTLPPHLALAEGAAITKNMVVSTAQGLGSLIAGAFTGSGDLSQVAGPIGIAGVGANAVQTGATATLWLTALISINLAIVNLLPIPGLDGGRLLILGIESVVRRPVPPGVATKLTLAGFAFILVIFVLVSIQDISRLVG